MYVLLFLISCEKRITVKSTKTITKPVCVRAFGEEGDGPEEAVRDAAQDIPLQDGPGTQKHAGKRQEAKIMMRSFNIFAFWFFLATLPAMPRCQGLDFNIIIYENGFYLVIKWILNICPWDFIKKQYLLNPMGGFNQYSFPNSHRQILLPARQLDFVIQKWILNLQCAYFLGRVCANRSNYSIS